MIVLWIIAAVAVYFAMAMALGYHLRRNREQHTLSPQEYSSIMRALEDYEGRGNT